MTTWLLLLGVILILGVLAWKARNNAELAKRLKGLGVVVAVLVPVGWAVTRLFPPYHRKGGPISEVQTSEYDMVIRVEVYAPHDIVMAVERVDEMSLDDVIEAAEQAREGERGVPTDAHPIDIDEIGWEWRLGAN